MRSRLALLGSILLAGVAAALWLELSPAQLLPGEGGLKVLGEFLGSALTPALVDEGGNDYALLPLALTAARDTVIFAAAGLSLALVGGLVLGFLAAGTTWAGAGTTNQRTSAVARAARTVTYASSRVLIAMMRSVHELVWAILFLSALGSSHATAVIAIAIPYAGTLAKVFSEMIDEAPRDAASAMRDAGAAPWQAFAFGVLPRALPDMAAYTFYRFECALRSAAVLGFFGFPTLGYYIAASFDNLYFREVWTYLYTLFLLIAVVDWWSGRLRQRLVVR